jgi:hypothetical protein
MLVGGKHMKNFGQKFATVDPNFVPATGGNFFSNMANGTYKNQPAPQIPAAVPASTVQSATPTTLANSFIGTTTTGQTKPNGYKVVG